MWECIPSCTSVARLHSHAERGNEARGGFFLFKLLISQELHTRYRLVIRPSTDVSRPSIELIRPSIDANRPSIEASISSIEASRSSIEASISSIEASRSSIEISRSSIETSRPSIEISISSIETGRPSVEISIRSTERKRAGGRVGADPVAGNHSPPTFCVLGVDWISPLAHPRVAPCFFNFALVSGGSTFGDSPHACTSRRTPCRNLPVSQEYCVIRCNMSILRPPLRFVKRLFWGVKYRDAVSGSCLYCRAKGGIARAFGYVGWRDVLEASKNRESGGGRPRFRRGRRLPLR